MGSITVLSFRVPQPRVVCAPERYDEDTEITLEVLDGGQWGGGVCWIITTPTFEGYYYDFHQALEAYTHEVTDILSRLEYRDG